MPEHQQPDQANKHSLSPQQWYLWCDNKIKNTHSLQTLNRMKQNFIDNLSDLSIPDKNANELSTYSCQLIYRFDQQESVIIQKTQKQQPTRDFLLYIEWIKSISSIDELSKLKQNELNLTETDPYASEHVKITMRYINTEKSIAEKELFAEKQELKSKKNTGTEQSIRTNDHFFLLINALVRQQKIVNHIKQEKSTLAGNRPEQQANTDDYKNTSELEEKISDYKKEIKTLKSQAQSNYQKTRSAICNQRTSLNGLKKILKEHRSDAKKDINENKLVKQEISIFELDSEINRLSRIKETLLQDNTHGPTQTEKIQAAPM